MDIFWCRSTFHWQNSSFFNAKLLISCVPMGLIWVKKSDMVLLFCLRISIWHARCDKNPLATYQSQLGRDSPHLRNGLYQKTAVFQFFALFDFGHPKWPPNGKIWTRVVRGPCQAMSGDGFGLWGQWPRYSRFGAILKSLKNALFSLKLKYLRYRELPIGHFWCGEYHTPGLLGAKKSGG